MLRIVGVGTDELLDDETSLLALVGTQHRLQPTGGEEDVAGLLDILQRFQSWLDESIADRLVDIRVK